MQIFMLCWVNFSMDTRLKKIQYCVGVSHQSSVLGPQPKTSVDMGVDYGHHFGDRLTSVLTVSSVSHQKRIYHPTPKS